MTTPAKSPGRVTQAELDALDIAIRPLVGTTFPILSLPKAGLAVLEPSQVGTIVGTIMDAYIPYLPDIPQVGLVKHEGILKDREGYPDYKHVSGFRAELKLLYIDNPALTMKKPATRREPSARLTQKVTVKNVDPARDTLLLVAYQLQPQVALPEVVSPTIVDLAVFSMIELVEARDGRMVKGGGQWFGNYETPTILSRIGRRKTRAGEPLEHSYGRKESEGKDFNEDTNFGKLKRIPHPGLQAFLAKFHGLAGNGEPETPDAVAAEAGESEEEPGNA